MLSSSSKKGITLSSWVDLSNNYPEKKSIMSNVKYKTKKIKLGSQNNSSNKKMLRRIHLLRHRLGW